MTKRISMLMLTFGMWSVLAAGQGLQPGQSVKVSQGPAPIMMGNQVLANVPAGTVLTVGETNGDWVGVSLTQGGQTIAGWMHKSYLAAPSAAPGPVPPLPLPAETPQPTTVLPGVEAEPSRVGEIRRLDGSRGAVLDVVFSPSGQLALSGGEDRAVRLWDVSSGRQVREFTGHQQAVTAVAFSPGGQQALSGSADTTVRLWDVANGRELRRLPAYEGAVWGVAWLPDGQRCVAVGDYLLVWDVAKGQRLQRVPAGGAGCDLAASRDGRLALSCVGYPPYKDAAGLWDVATARLARVLRGHTARVRGVALSPDGSRAATCGDDATMRLWDTASGNELHRFTGHLGPVLAVAFSPDGRRLLTGGADRSVRLWDIEGRRQIELLRGHTQAVQTVAFSPGGRYALSGGQDMTIRLWGLPK